jgi:hypothetical protein
MNWIRAIFFGAVVSAVSPAAYAGEEEDEGVPVTVQVLDEEGAPVATAVVRHPQEADRHRVNTFDGKWTADVLYLPDGSELVFLKGLELELEVSAPGYINERVKYVIRKRKNLVSVVLRKMDFSLDVEEEEDPVIQFGRDKPIDGASTEPEN